MMFIPKKDGPIRTIDDFCILNKQLKRKCYPLPKIQDTFHCRCSYKLVLILGLILWYYTYELDEVSSWLCILVTSFGKYRHKRLPMGISSTNVSKPKLTMSVSFPARGKTILII